MQALEPLTEILLTGADLEADQATVVAELLIRSEVSTASKRECLLALARKGETALLDAGYTSVLHLEGGLAAWKAAGLPVERAE